MSEQRAMLHCTAEQRDRLNQLAEQEGCTQRDMITRLIDAYIQPKEPDAPPLATRSITHQPLLVYGKGATLRIDSNAQPYVALPDGKQWQRLKFEPPTYPWE